MDALPVRKYGFTIFSKNDCTEILTRNGFEVVNVTENKDIDIELNGKKFKNAFVIVKAFTK